MTARHGKTCAFWALLLAFTLLYAVAFAREAGAVEVGTWKELSQAVKDAKKGDVITLTGDITMTGDDTLVSKKEQEIVIDLGGHTLSEAVFSQGTFSIRNGELNFLWLAAEGKGLSVALEESVICKGPETLLPAVMIMDEKGKVSFSNAGQIEGLYGISIQHSAARNVKITNTGTILADVHAFEWNAQAGGSLAVVNDGRMESRCCAAVHLAQVLWTKNAATVSITGTGELVGACGVQMDGNNKSTTIDQRITATYISEKSQAVLDTEKLLASGIQGLLFQTFDEDVDSADPKLLAMASLRNEEVNGVAVALDLAEEAPLKLTLSGTLSATNKLLAAPNVLPYGSKDRLTLNASVAPDSQADSFDVLLPLDKALKTFDEATAQKKLKASMTRLDVDDFLEGGGRLRVCVSAPMTNDEGKLLVSVVRDALAPRHLGGYLTAEGIQWDEAVAKEVYSACAPQPLTEEEDVFHSFRKAVSAKTQYGVYLDCDVRGGEDGQWNAYRDAKQGRLYVEGNGHTLQMGRLKVEALTLRGLTLSDMDLEGKEMTLANCRCEDVVQSPSDTKAITETVVQDCYISKMYINQSKRATLQNCQYETLRLDGIDKAVLSGVSEVSGMGEGLYVWHSNIELDEGCTVPRMRLSVSDGETVSVVNNSRNVGSIILASGGGTAKLSGKGSADYICLSPADHSTFAIQHDANELHLYAGDWRGSLSWTGDVRNAHLFDLSPEASVSFEGTVGYIAVDVPEGRLTFRENEASILNFFTNQLKSLGLGNSEPMKDGFIHVTLSTRTKPVSQDGQTCVVKEARYSLAYQNGGPVYTGCEKIDYTYSNQNGTIGDELSRTIERYDAQGNRIPD